MATRPLSLSPTDIARVYDADRALRSQETAFRALSDGSVIQAPRVLVQGTGASVAFCYTNRLSLGAPAVTKFGSVNPGNPQQGIPSISAVITVLDPETGQVRAIMDGNSVTTLRTSAASALAARELSNPGCTRLGIIGSGVQAQAHARALAAVLPDLERIALWGPVATELSEAVARLQDLPGIEVEAGAGAREVATDSPVLALCTTSPVPVIEYSWLRPGSTLLGIGSFAPDRREVPPELIRSARIVVDDRQSALDDAGPIIDAVADGSLDPTTLVTLGDVLTGRAVGRRDADEIVYYNSVGVGIQDASAAASILDGAAAQGLGLELEW